MTELIGAIVRHYLESGDFNGYGTRSIGGSEDGRRKIIRDLVEAGEVSINFGDRHPNPHILAFAPEPVDVQLKKLADSDLQSACLYPTAERLQKTLGPMGFPTKPFTGRLAHGEPQLELVYFDLRVLEQYRNDPRYSYWTDDINGRLSVSDAFFQSEKMREKDQVLLQSFGFGYDREVNERVVAVFLRYLSDLSPEHQQIWNTHRLDGDYHPHPDYWRSSMGEWPERVSIFQAFTEELKQINLMAALMGRQPLFKMDYSDGARPRGFSFLIRPTLSEFNAFVHLLDKMLSENINTAFFGTEVDMETYEERKDGKVVARPKGSITALKEWTARMFRTKDEQPLNEALATLKRVRTLRQKPAHAVHEDEFDQRYFREQRELVMKAYEAVRTLRLILANHPATKKHEVPDWLFKGEIWTR